MVCVNWNAIVCENSVTTCLRIDNGVYTNIVARLSEMCPFGKCWSCRTVLSLNVFVLFHADNV